MADILVVVFEIGSLFLVFRGKKEEENTLRMSFIYSPPHAGLSPKSMRQDPTVLTIIQQPSN